MHVLEVAATMDRREAAFPEKEGKPWRNYMCCNFGFLLLFFCWGFGFVLFLLHGGCGYSHFLTLRCPRAEWSTDWELTGTWHCHSQYVGQKVKELTSHQTLPSSGKHDNVASNVVRDEGEGNDGFVCGTSQRWPREVEVLLSSSCESRGPPSPGEMGQSGQVGADCLGGKSTNTPCGIWHLNW